MALLAIYKLIPRSAFHFGERGVGLEETADVLHSDTLFSAIVSAWRALGEEPDPKKGNDLPSVQLFRNGQPSFRVSSALPYVGDVLLLPRPLIPLGMGSAKALKKVDFVSAGALRLLSQRQVPDTHAAKREQLLQRGRIWIAPEERRDVETTLLEAESDVGRRERLRYHFQRDTRDIALWSRRGEAVVPHVAVDRINTSSNLFFTGRLQFAPGCGLYFWVKFADPNTQSKLDNAMTFLGVEGLGGRRSTGHGQFEFKDQERSLPAVSEPNFLMTLSLYHPTEDEIQAGVLHNAWYKRIHRRGWIYSPESKKLFRKGLWMLREGSVFPMAIAEQNISGMLENVKPEDEILPPDQRPFPHPVWRYGYALTMPVRLEGLP